MTCLNKRNSLFPTKVLSLLLAVSFLGATSCSEKDKPKTEGTNEASFMIDPKESSEYDFTPSGERNSSGVYYQKLLSLKICLKDIAESKTIAKSQFKVIAGKVSVVKVTDAFGCFMWKEELEFDPMNDDKTVFMSRRIEAVGNHIGGVDFEYSVNPSQEKGKVVIYPGQKSNEDGESASLLYKSSGITKIAGKNFSYDVHVNIDGEVNDQKTKDENKSASQNKTLISSLDLNYRSLDYQNISVDRYLNLVLPYSYTTSFSISFLKQKQAQVTEEKIRKGNFIFHLVFARALSSGAVPQVRDIYSAVQFKGSPSGDQGIINVPVTLTFDNIPALSSRMSVFLTVTSVDQPALFEDQTYEGVVNGISANQKLQIALNSTDVSARQLYANVKSNRISDGQGSIAKVLEALKNEGFWVVEQSRLSFTRTNAEQVTVDLSKLVADARDEKSLDAVELEALCEAIFHGTTDKIADKVYHKCLRDPKGVLVAKTHEYVSSLNGITGGPWIGQTETFVLSSKMSINKEKTNEVGANRKVGFSFDQSDLDLGLFGLNKFGVSKIKYGVEGGMWTAVGTVTNMKDESTLQNVSSDYLMSQQVVVEIDVQLQKCLLVSVNKKAREELKDSSFAAERAICADGLREKRKEQYFFIQQTKKDMASNGFVDTNAQELNPVRIMMIRGNKIYDSFMSVVRSKNVIEWAMMDQRKDEMTTFLTEEAPMMLSAETKMILPDASAKSSKFELDVRKWDWSR